MNVPVYFLSHLFEEHVGELKSNVLRHKEGCHPRAGGDPDVQDAVCGTWIPHTKAQDGLAPCISRFGDGKVGGKMDGHIDDKVAPLNFFFI